MAMFGYCPRWEDFYLVICDFCKQSVKPQALKQHIGNKLSLNTINCRIFDYSLVHKIFVFWN